MADLLDLAARSAQAVEAHRLAGSPGVPVVAASREELLALYPSDEPEQLRPADGDEHQHEDSQDDGRRDSVPLGKRG